jgi:hypothetical protein
MKGGVKMPTLPVAFDLLERHIIALERQRVVNKALLAYLEKQHPSRHGHESAAALAAAIREALQ